MALSVSQLNHRSPAVTAFGDKGFQHFSFMI
jgi:hypothetical protein